MTVDPRLNDFLAWWFQGLLLLLPERWLARLRRKPDIVTVEQGDDALTFKLYDGNSGKLRKERAIAPADKTGQAAVNRWLGRHENELDLVVLLPPDKQLKKRLAYPISSEQELRAILNFEMDKQTPFPNDKVCFDFTVIRRDTDNGRIHINLYVVLRKILEKHLDSLRFLDLKPAAATTGADGLKANINFLSRPDRILDRAPARRLKQAALLATILLLAALYLPLLRYDSVAGQLEQQAEQSRTQALQARALINRKQSIVERVDFLSHQARRHIPVVRLMHDLTRRLPDHTWIYQLVINGGEIQLQGESDAATAIIRLLEESDYLEQAQFRSPVTKNAATRKERFHVAARISIE